MKKIIHLIALIFLIGSCQQTQHKNAAQEDNDKVALPYLKDAGNHTQFIVDGEPFIMISGELHNSSSSTEYYIEKTFNQLKDMNLNSVIAAVTWEQFEPEEGVFDYSLVESLVENARKHNLKLVLIWFASWKNGQSSYMPLWVKKDTKRFFRVQDANGNEQETVSVFCEEAMKADARAYGKLFEHVRKIDHDRTVIMGQPENEVGIFLDIDHNPLVLEKFNTESVPAQLIDYMVKNKPYLKESVHSVWAVNNYPISGTWNEVFGTPEYAKEFFMTWYYATYINEVTKAGKKAYNIPMFVNAWIVQKPDDLPGVYPNGGPVSKVMDIYKAAAPDIDLVCPDIYLPNFKEIIAMYHRDDNALLVPESTLNAGRAFYAFAEHDALCYSPFAIEDGYDNFLYTESYRVLNELAPLILQYQGTGKMIGVLKESDNEPDREVVFGDYRLNIKHEKNGEESFGLIIQTSNDEFLIAGMNFKVFFSSVHQDQTGYIGQVWEGDYKDGEWNPTRLLNGDESWHNEVVRVFGTKFRTEEVKEVLVNTGGDDPFTYSSSNKKEITVPGVYKVKTYMR